MGGETECCTNVLAIKVLMATVPFHIPFLKLFLFVSFLYECVALQMLDL